MLYNGFAIDNFKQSYHISCKLIQDMLRDSFLIGNLLTHIHPKLESLIAGLEIHRTCEMHNNLKQLETNFLQDEKTKVQYQLLNNIQERFPMFWL